MSPTDREGLDAVAALVREHCGLVVDAARLAAAADAIAPADHLREDPAALQTLVERLTIGETYFARIPPQIRMLRDVVLPALLAGSRDRRLRIWCAGCSTGEEPYTVALVLAELLGAGAGGWDIEIVGTDINTQALAAARTGRYAGRAVSLLSEAELERHFVRTGDAWTVGARLREWVRFQPHNLLGAAPPAPQADLILCRNVMIYFDRPTMRRVLDRFHRTLAPGGWLLLGHSETLWRLHDGFDLVRSDDAFVYRRRPIGPPAAAPADPVVPAPRRTPAPTRSVTLVEPVDAIAPVERITRALDAGAFTTAADLAAGAAAADPLASRLHHLHGRALVELDRDDEALAALRRAAYLDPRGSTGSTEFLLAVVLGRLGHEAEARRAYAVAAQAFERRAAGEPVADLGGRRAGDLAVICRRLAAGRLTPAGGD